MFEGPACGLHLIRVFANKLLKNSVTIYGRLYGFEGKALSKRGSSAFERSVSFDTSQIIMFS